MLKLVLNPAGTIDPTATLCNILSPNTIRVNGFFALDVVELAIQLLLQITKSHDLRPQLTSEVGSQLIWPPYYCGGPTTLVYYNFLWEVSLSPKRPLLFVGQVWSAMAFMALMSPPTKHLIKQKLFGIPHNRGVIWVEIQPRRSFEAANHDLWWFGGWAILPVLLIQGKNAIK